MDAPWYSAKAFWGPRADTPTDLGARLLRTADALSTLHPLMEKWWVLDQFGEGAMVPLDRARHRIASIVADQVIRDDDEEPEPDGGYFSAFSNKPDGEPSQIGLKMHGGVERVPRFYQNSMGYETPYDRAAEPALVAYPLVKSVLMTMVETWEATSAIVLCSALLEQPRAKDGRLFRPAWMTYLAASAASRVTPPSDALCERTPDGGLLMIAAQATFDPNDPGQVAAANAISDALLPIRDRTGL